MSRMKENRTFMVSPRCPPFRGGGVWVISSRSQLRTVCTLRTPRHRTHQRYHSHPVVLLTTASHPPLHHYSIPIHPPRPTHPAPETDPRAWVRDSFPQFYVDSRVFASSSSRACRDAVPCVVEHSFNAISNGFSRTFFTRNSSLLGPFVDAFDASFVDGFDGFKRGKIYTF